MIKWIKKYWLLLVVTGGMLVGVITNIDSCVDKRNYRKEIKGLDSEIAMLKQGMKESQIKIDTANEHARIAEDEARKERAEKEKHKANTARIAREKEDLRAQIAALPPTQVVVRIVEALRVEPKEVTLQKQGVLFTLVATRRCLEELDGFTLVKKEMGELRLSLARSEAADKKTQKANIKLNIAITGYKKQLSDWLELEVKWNNKFILSENRRKRALARGRKEGAIAGGIIGFFGGLFLGR